MEENTDNVIQEKTREVLEGTIVPNLTEPDIKPKITISRKNPLSEAKRKLMSVRRLNTIAKNNAIKNVKEGIEGTNKPLFTVTPHMDRWVNTAVSLVSDSPSDISPVAKVSRESWYTWLKIPGFREWFYAQYKAKRYMWIPKLDRMGMDRAPKSYDYWLAMNKKAGDLLEDSSTKQPQQVVSILGGMTINNIKNEVNDK